MNTDIDIDQLKAMYESNEITINNNVYSVSKMDHSRRVGFFATFQKVAKEATNGSFDFLATAEWRAKEKELGDFITLNGSQLNKIPNYWEDNQADYLSLIYLGLAVISYPFLQGLVGN